MAAGTTPAIFTHFEIECAKDEPVQAIACGSTPDFLYAYDKSNAKN